MSSSTSLSMIRLKNFDWSFVIAPLLLIVLSIATIYTITYVSVGARLALSQTVYALIGFGLFFLFTRLDYRHLRSLAWPLFGVGIVLLLPLLPVVSHKIPFVICEFNACRWINLGIFRLQSSEIFKLISIVIMSGLLAQRIGKVKWWHFFGYTVLFLLPAWLIMEQPDLGTALIVSGCGLFFLLVTRFPLWLWGVLLIGSIVVAPLAWQHLKPYQKKRIEIFLHPEQDLNRTGYNVRQAEIAVGSGGVIGRGFGQGSQSQLNFLPVAHTDFIFAGYAEATGYIGCLVLLVIFVFLLWRVLYVAEIAKDSFGRLLALGIFAMLSLQFLINIGMNIRLMPVTGVPLPFVSYGGTSLFVNMMALGILESITLRHKKLSFT